jgi:DNA polymerase I-like protein with 3'-5' exonuclease and polymerase domains
MSDPLGLLGEPLVPRDRKPAAISAPVGVPMQKAVEARTAPKPSAPTTLASVPISLPQRPLQAPVVAAPRAIRGSPVTGAVVMPESAWRPPPVLPNLRGRRIDFIGIDTETTGLEQRKDRIVGVSLAVSSDGPRLYLPFGHDGDDNMPEDVVRRWMTDEVVPLDTEFVGAHLLFDLEMLARWGVRFPKTASFHDVQVAEPLLDEWLDDYKLDSLGLRYLGIGKDRSLMKAAASRHGWNTDAAMMSNLWRLPARYVGPYAEADADLPARIWARQKPLIEEQELTTIYDIERKLIPVLLAMRLRGVRIDVPRAETFLGKLVRERDARLADLKRVAGHAAEFKSVASLAPALRERGLDVPRTASSTKHPDGQDSITESWLVEHRGDALVDAIMVGRRVQTLATYIEKSILERVDDGRIYPVFNQLRRSEEDGNRRGTIARLCLSGGTEIMVPNGIRLIEDVRPGDLVYCYDENQRLVLRKVKWSGKTGLKPVVKALFKRGLTSNDPGYKGKGRALFLTGDHHVRLADGSYMPIRDTLPGTRVMSLHRVGNGQGMADHLHIFGHPKGRGQAEHRVIYSITHEITLTGGRQIHIHHKDNNHFNNAPENLEMLSISDHIKQHQTPEEARRRALLAHQRYGDKITSSAASAMDRWSKAKNPPEKILELFNQDMTISGIAKSLTIRTTTVVKRLIEAGIPEDKIPERYRSLINHVLYSVEEIPGIHEVYDIEVENCHNFIANEICVHNSCSQPNLQAVAKREKIADSLIDIDEEVAKATRCLFLPEESEEWQRDDFSQEEFRLTVSVAIGKGADEARAKYVENPRLSFHKMAGEMAGIDPDDKKQYDKIKALNLAKSYGAQRRKIAIILKCSLDEADAFIKNYESSLPFTVDTFNAAKRVADEQGFIRTILKRRQRFPLWEPRNNRGDRWRPPMLYDRAFAAYGEDIVRAGTYMALNRYDQGSGADIIKKAMVDGWEAGICDVLGAYLLSEHDELDVSCPLTPEGDEAGKELTRIMENVVKLRVPLLVESSRGPNWGECA